MANKNWREQCSKKQRFWQAHIRAWEKSGFSQNEYCRKNQLNACQFRYWKKKLVNASKITLKFVPVPVRVNDLQAKIDHGDSGVSIIIDNEIQVRLNNNFNASTLVKVVATLGAQS